MNAELTELAFVLDTSGSMGGRAFDEKGVFCPGMQGSFGRSRC